LATWGRSDEGSIMNGKNHFRLAVLAGLAALLVACSPDVGSEAWCQDMKQKAKGDWTANEAADFAKHCILG
jgi:hypothetical protein